MKTVVLSTTILWMQPAYLEYEAIDIYDVEDGERFSTYPLPQNVVQKLFQLMVLPPGTSPLMIV